MGPMASRMKRSCARETVPDAALGHYEWAGHVARLMASLLGGMRHAWVTLSDAASSLRREALLIGRNLADSTGS